MIIKDELISPYIIKVTDCSFDVAKTGTNDKGKYTESAVGYYSKLSNALSKIARIQVIKENDELNLEQYGKELDSKLSVYSEKFNK